MHSGVKKFNVKSVNVRSPLCFFKEKENLYSNKKKLNAFYILRKK